MTAAEKIASEGDEPAARVFEFGGRSFTLRPGLDLRAVMALQRGDFDRALTLVLGPEQTAELIDLDTDEAFDDAAIARLFDVLAEAQGASRGESSASPTS